MTLSRNKTNRPARRTAPKSVRRLYSAAALVETLESRMLLSVVRFEAPIPTEIGGSLGKPFAVDIADVNGDGVPDVVVANADGTVTVLLGNDNGDFQSPITVSDGLPIGAGTQQDLAVSANGDEIFVTNPEDSGAVSVLRNTGDGNFVLAAAPRFTSAAYISAVGYTSIAGVGALVAAENTGNVALLLDPQLSGRFPTDYYGVTAAIPTQLAIGETTGEGGELADEPEIFVLDASNQVHLLSFATGSGATTSLASLLTGFVPDSIAVTDLTGDGIDDLVLGSASGSVEELLGNATGFFLGQNLKVSAADSSGVGIRTGDVDGSGNEGVLFLEYSANGATAQPLSGSATGTLTVNGATLTLTTPVALADVNGDGKADVVEGYYTFATDTSGVNVLLNDSSIPPVFTSANSTKFAEGFTGTFTVTTTGSPTAALSETGALPAGVTFVDNGNGTATLSGTPTVMGTFNLTLIANDGLDAPVDQSFTLNVVAPASPAITSTAATTFTTGRRGSFTVTTTGIPFPAITDGSATLPSGVTFVDNKNGTATLSGTPAAGTGGVYDFTITANNGVGSPATQAFVLTVNERTAITNADSTIFVVGTAGSFTFTTTGYPSPTLSTVVGDLPTGVTFTNNGNGTATLAGTPALGAGGIYLLPITAANGIGGNATQNFVLTVDEAPSFTTANNATFTVSVSGSFEFITRGYPKATLTESGMLPFGLSFAAGTGTDTAFLSGIPALGQGGSYPITISASNGVGGVVSQSFTVNVQSSPEFLGGTQENFAIGATDSFTLSTKAIPTAAFTESGTVPSGLSFHDNGNGTLTLSGVPPTADKGTYKFGITATNSLGSTSENITLTITTAAAPKFTSAAAATFTVGTASSFTINTSGVSTPTLAMTGTVPSGLTFTNNGDGTATISGTALAGSGGVYTLSLSATNSVSKVTQSLVVTVLEATNFTTAASSNFVVGTHGSVTIHTNGYPVPVLSEIGALPAGVTFASTGSGNATLSGTPAAGSGGSYTLTIVASNSTSAKTSSKSKKTTGAVTGDTQTFILNVFQSPAFTSAASATVKVGVNFVPIVVTTTGFPAAALSVAGTLPNGVSFLDDGDGTGELLGAPQSGSGGTYVFIITATNNQGSISQTYTLTVDAAVTITSANSTTFAAGSPGSFAVTTSGYPIASLLSSVLPSGLTFTNNGNGTGTLAGTVATAGTYRFTFTVSNGAGSQYIQAFTLTVS